MKIPALPWIIAGLGVIVGGLVLWQTFRHPLWLVTKPVSAPPAKPVSPAAQSPAEPGSAIDQNYVETHLPGWLAARRDPFLQSKPPTPQMQMNQLNVLNRLKLKAIWRQNGVTMAAINHGVYHPGDVLEGFKIVSIDESGVALENNGQKATLLFGSQVPDSAPEMETNPPVPKIVVAPPEDPATALNAAMAALKAVGYLPKEAGQPPPK